MVVHRKKNDLLDKDVATCLCHSFWQGELFCTRERVVNTYEKATFFIKV